MDKFQVFLDGVETGEMTVMQEGLYDVFRVSCHPPTENVLRAFAIGERGELRLGIPVPDGTEFTVCHRIALHEVEAAGRLLRGELRPCDGESRKRWEAVKNPERLFRSTFLREQLRGMEGILTRKDGGVRFLALPFDSHRPFLLTSLFCFARVKRIGGQPYAVFAFDRGENPIFTDAG